MYDYIPLRRKTKTVTVGNLNIGSDHPVLVQSMTNTLTEDINATHKQIIELEEAGVDIIRISCPNKASTEALAKLVKVTNTPIIADIHFHYKRAIEAAIAGASCLRINPGNIGNKQAVKDVVQAAKDYGCSIRIGVNAGSLEKNILDKYTIINEDAMVESAMNHIKILEDEDFYNFKISVKASNVFLCVKSYQKLSQMVDYPLHLGVTEAGGLLNGTVLSSIGIGQLLYQGIGDTIRVSLSAHPVEEVKVGFKILSSLNIRHKGVKIISCPSCARQGFDVVTTVAKIEKALAHITEPIVISILGCVVNGIGEAAHSHIGVVGVSTGENMVYINGKKHHKVSNDNLVDSVVSIVNEYIGGQFSQE